MFRNPYSPKGFLIMLLALFAFIAVYPNATRADKTSKYQKILEEWSQKLPDLEKSDTGETAKEIALIRSWIGQAQAFVANENFERIEPILERIKFLSNYILVRQTRAQLDAVLKKADAKLKELNEAISQTRKEADALGQQIKKDGESK